MSAGSDDAGFLGRWAQRKAQARQKEPENNRAPAIDEEGPLDQPTAAEKPAPFDVETLPKLDEITAETNMSDFLRQEAPESLRNAALRKAWALDPAIRDYVNPAMEYAWDWNVPGGAPGSGELEAGFDIAKAVESMFSASGSQPPDHPLVEEHGPNAVSESPEFDTHISANPPDAAADSAPQVLASNEKSDDSARASERSAEVSSDRVIDPSRLRKTRARHGGATPV